MSASARPKPYKKNKKYITSWFKSIDGSHSCTNFVLNSKSDNKLMN